MYVFNPFTGTLDWTAPGVPPGGAAAQYLRKTSGANYDTAFAQVSAAEVSGLGALATQNSYSNLRQLLSSGGAAPITARGQATSGTSESFLFTARVLANTAAPSNFRITMRGQSSSTGTLIFSVRAGAAGTTADTQIFKSITSTAQAANSYASLQCIVEEVAAGTTNTVGAHGFAVATANVLNQATAAEVLANVNTAADWFITVSATCSVGTFTTLGACVEGL